jgi:1-acyl-sn-glycerol-3-phosphate acyltransferase
MPSHEIPLSTRIGTKAAFKGILELTSHGIQVEGRENLPKEPPFLIAFNHFGWVEGLVPHILLPVKDYPYVITKIENTKGRLGKMLPPLGFIGIRRGEADMSAIRKSVELLRNGRIIATALEGTRGRGDERLKPKTAKAGLIFLATQFEEPLPIIPMAIWGQNEWTFPLIDVGGFKLKDLGNLRKEPLFIRIGKPFIPDLGARGEGMKNSEIRDILANQLQERIQALLPPNYS